MNRRSFSNWKVCLALLCILPCAWASPGGASNKDEEEFLNWIRSALPSHSAMPPETDLAIAMAPAASRAWEEKYRNMEGLIKRDVTDISDDDSSAPGSMVVTTKEETGGIALPARDSSLIVIGTASSGASHVSFNKHLVYSDYQISVKERLKGSKADFHSEHASINVLLFGGGIRFATGYTEYFVIQGVGFLENGKDYLLFLWKSTKGMRAYDLLGAYLLEKEEVYPIVVGREGAYAGTPVREFESAVRSAIKANVNR